MEEKEAPSGQRGNRNDYADNFYTQDRQDDPDIPDFEISPSVDKIKVGSIPVKFLDPISNLLTENGFKKGKVTIPKGKYDRNRSFNDGETGIKVFYNLPSSDFGGLPLFIEIDDPTQEIINLLNSFFSRFSISHKISQLEIAFDFLSDDQARLRDALDRHLFLKYQSSRYPSFSINTTYYSSDCRKTSKGTRTYRKKVKGQRVVRLELVLNRRSIKRLGLELSTILIVRIDFSKYFSFKTLDIDRLTYYLIRLNIVEVEELDKFDGMSGQLLVRTIESWVRSKFYPSTPSDDKFMKYMEELKKKGRKIPNYSRFLNDHIVLNQKFKEALVGKAFVPYQKKK
jgi:hypothetical protein